LLGLIFSFLRLIGLIRIIHPERIPRESGSFIIAPNHRSYWEPILMPGIFFPWSMLQPLRRVPWCALDPKGFESWWIFKALRPRFVLVRRESRREMVVALLRMIDVLREGDRLILYAEGTRLYKAKEVRVAPSGNRLGKLQSGITTLVQQTSAPILPVWVDGSDRIMPPGPISSFLATNDFGDRRTVVLREAGNLQGRKRFHYRNPVHRATRACRGDTITAY
jgi:1-acyl-sn-glycerol-3-phosphate acyltransferase